MQALNRMFWTVYAVCAWFFHKQTKSPGLPLHVHEFPLVIVCWTEKPPVIHR